MKKLGILIGVALAAITFTGVMFGQQSTTSRADRPGTGTTSIQARQEFVGKFRDQLRKEYLAVKAKYPLVARYMAFQELTCARPIEEDTSSCKQLVFITEEAIRFISVECELLACMKKTEKCLMHPDPDIRCGECGISQD